MCDSEPARSALPRRDAPDGRAADPRSTGPGPEPTTPVWLVDAYNVIQVTLLGGADRTGWWRREARTRLATHAAGMPGGADGIWLVFDGPDPAPPSSPDAPGPHTVFAPSADEWIVRRVKARSPAATFVVTADRRLAGRCRGAGATVVAPGDFVAACRSDPPGDASPDGPDPR